MCVRVCVRVCACVCSCVCSCVCVCVCVCHHYILSTDTTDVQLLDAKPSNRGAINIRIKTAKNSSLIEIPVKITNSIGELVYFTTANRSLQKRVVELTTDILPKDLYTISVALNFNKSLTVNKTINITRSDYSTPSVTLSPSSSIVVSVTTVPSPTRIPTPTNGE